MPKQAHQLTHYLPKTLIVAVEAPYNKDSNFDSFVEEFRNLVITNRIQYDHELLIKLRRIDPAYFFTEGKLEELKKFCDENEIEEVIISEILTPQQERELSDVLRCRVYDRTQLILEIFEKGAHSAEGKAQVAIAMLQHLKTRMAGKGIHLSQQAGMRGFRGGYGETAKEKERRHIEKTILNLEKQLARVQKTRKTQRKQRLTRGIKQICLIGYTNAGKSTILNALTKSTVLAEDKLFATLDTTTRELYLDGKKCGLISDTVGFIQQLPHHLIKAFKSTLSELEYADLLVQVIDISDPSWEKHIEVVQEILADLNIHQEMVYVFNKADRITLTHAQQDALQKYRPHVITSSLAKDGLDQLRDYLSTWCSHRTN